MITIALDEDTHLESPALGLNPRSISFYVA